MKVFNINIILSLLALAVSAVQAHGRRSTLQSNQRGYDYHRRHMPSSAIDLVSDIFSVPFYQANTLYRQQLASQQQQFDTPRYFISESEDGNTVEVVVEVPGVSSNDLAIEVENGNLLHITGHRTMQQKGSSLKSAFHQSFQMEDIDEENISVSLKNGILSISAPKKKPVVKRIPLKINEITEDEDKVGSRMENTVEENYTGSHEEEAEDAAADLIITDDE